MGHKMAISEKPYCHQPKLAFTRLLVLELGLYNNYPATKVLLKPITGRRHQLRVHCSALGHTIVGDFTYSNQKDILPYRMFLHAQRLIVPTKIEIIDVCTKDPFTLEDPRNKWTSLKTVNAFDASRQNVYQKIDTQGASVTIGT
jgi:23S rRNA-/tRNA-specific pseudouridylate synthase